MKPPARTFLLDSLVLLLLTAALIAPLFTAGYLDLWHSIESTFIADARFLSEHWPHPGWQPLWYCGTRFDYVYPPALRYGTAGLSLLLGIEPVRAYHLYIAFFYCLGIVAVYAFVRVAGGSRAAGWLSAVATALLSPSFLLIRTMRHDAFHLAPVRLGVLVRYGEGPHITALALLPLALLFAWRALPGRRPGSLALAALFSALVVSNNFYGAVALAMLFPIAAWSLYNATLDRAVWLRAAAIAALAYGLTAIWLVPSYVRVTLDNMRFVSSGGNRWSLAVLVAVTAIYVLATRRLARGRKELAWVVFLAGSLAVMSLNVLGHYTLNFRILGEPGRHVPELDLAITLAAVEMIRRLWNRGSAATRVGLALIAAGCLLTARGFVRHAWELYPASPDHRQQIEYRIPERIAKNHPGSRSLVAGSVRFWYNAWFNLQQAGGGSEQGLLNPLVMSIHWFAHAVPETGPALQWLLALGVDLVAVHDQASTELYHDSRYPQKFRGLLPVAYDNGAGDVIYRVPRRFPGLARVVETARLDRLRPVLHGDDLEAVRAYAGLLENGPDAAAASSWEGPARMRIRARLAPGQSLIVQESHDPNWRASTGTVRKDVMGFMRIDAPPGDHDLLLEFQTPFENRAGRMLTLVSLAIFAALAFAGARRR